MDKAKDALRAVAKPIEQAPTPSLSPTPTPTPTSTDDEDDSDPAETPRDTPGAKLEEQSTPEAPHAKQPKLADAVRLVSAGKVDEGVQLLYQLRKASPKSPAIALWLGHAYFKKLWRTDGLREYGDALAGSPALRRDAQLIKNAVSALDDPTYRHARALLRKRVGAIAIPELRRASRDGSKNARTQARAARLASELGRRRRR
jgi:hypothetical protein